MQSRLRQKRFTVGSLTSADLAKLAILDLIVVLGSAKTTSATFSSDLLKDVLALLIFCKILMALLQLAIICFAVLYI